VVVIAALGSGVYYWKFVRTPTAPETAPVMPESAAPAAEALPAEAVPLPPEPAPAPTPEPTPAPEAGVTPEPAAATVTPAEPAPAPAPATTAPAKAPASPPGLPPEITARIKTLMNQGRTYNDQLQYDKAIATAESVLMLDPGNREARKLMNDAKAGQQAALKSIEIE